MSPEIDKATIERLKLWAPLASGFHTNDPAPPRRRP